jgi:hypothetical protein
MKLSPKQAIVFGQVKNCTDIKGLPIRRSSTNTFLSLQRMGLITISELNEYGQTYAFIKNN